MHHYINITMNGWLSLHWIMSKVLHLFWSCLMSFWAKVIIQSRCKKWEWRSWASWKPQLGISSCLGTCLDLIALPPLWESADWTDLTPLDGRICIFCEMAEKCVTIIWGLHLHLAQLTWPADDSCVIFILFQTRTVQMQEPYEQLTYTFLLSM